MGWWKVQGTENIIGDGPLEPLEEAVAEILAEYQSAFDRKPTKAEWETLLHAVLGGDAAEERVTDEGVVKRVLLELDGNSGRAAASDTR